MSIISGYTHNPADLRMSKTPKVESSIINTTAFNDQGEEFPVTLEVFFRVAFSMGNYISFIEEIVYSQPIHIDDRQEILNQEFGFGKWELI